jgi:hypothetical protein
LFPTSTQPTSTLSMSPVTRTRKNAFFKTRLKV